MDNENRIANLAEEKYQITFGIRKPTFDTRLEILDGEQKEYNRKASKFRIAVERVNRRIKRFKILQQRYRNKQRKHFLRISLICGIYNYALRF